MFKKALVIFCLAFSLPAFCTTTVYFINGIDGKIEKSAKSRDKIIRVLSDNNYLLKFGGLDIDIRYWLNPGDGFFEDKFELLDQANISAAALLAAKYLDLTATVNSSLYKSMLGKYYKDAIEAGAADTETRRHIFSVVKNIAAAISVELLTGENLL